MSVFDRLRSTLARARDALGERLRAALAAGPGPEAYEQLEEALILADVGARTAGALIEELRREATRRGAADARALRALLAELLLGRLPPPEPLRVEPGRLNVLVLVGVNGSGKTTTAAKLARWLQSRGFTPLLAAADTFRAAAAEQLAAWGSRLGVDVVRQQPGADPGAVAFDALAAARARGADAVVVDTAGRLHTRGNLMEELKKVVRVVGRQEPGAPHEVLLVLDATTGQNGLVQARAFTEAVGVTGLVLTKLDSTARAGIVVAIRQELGLPVKLAGVGEGPDDLIPFDPAAFVAALLGEPGALDGVAGPA